YLRSVNGNRLSDTGSGPVARHLIGVFHQFKKRLHRCRILGAAESEGHALPDFLVRMILQGDEFWLASSVAEMTQRGDRLNQDSGMTFVSHEIQESIAAFLG